MKCKNCPLYKNRKCIMGETPIQFKDSVGCRRKSTIIFEYARERQGDKKKYNVDTAIKRVEIHLKYGLYNIQDKRCWENVLKQLNDYRDLLDSMEE